MKQIVHYIFLWQMEADEGQRKENQKYTTNLLVLKRREGVMKLYAGNLFPAMS